MKILSAEQIRQADQYTIQHEPVSSIDLMERAARSVFQWIITNFDPGRSFAVVSGTGNNGGDGLAVARMLREHGYQVDIFIINGNKKGSEDFEKNRARLTISAKNLEGESDYPDFNEYDFLVDAIFGTGLSRPVEGLYADIIGRMNKSRAKIIAIDMPSGMFTDVSTEGNPVINATYTLTFQLPKLGLLMPENGINVGEWHIMDIQLEQGFIDSCETGMSLITDRLAAKGLKTRRKYSHKGDFGRAVLMAGSYGKMGAAVLAARAAMRSGLGLLTTYIPKCGYNIMQTTVPEAMVEVDQSDDFLSGIPDIKSADALGIGPGIGQEHETVYALEEVMRKFGRPMVIDADGLNLLAAHPHLQKLIPENSILTPHPGEFARLSESWSDDFDRLERLRNMAQRLKVIIVLKGAHTSVALPDKTVFFNISGNPGMATGGCGDVLTGILTSLIAQGTDPVQAAITGVYIHGLAGDIAARYQSQTGMTAGDVVDYLPDAWSMLED